MRRSRLISLSAAACSTTRFTRATSFAGFACNRRRRIPSARKGAVTEEGDENTDMVRVGFAELKVEAALHVGEGAAGVGERRQDVVHRRMVLRPPPARIRRHPDLPPVRQAGWGWGWTSLFQPLAIASSKCACVQKMASTNCYSC